MPLKSGRLTPSELAFSRSYAETGNLAYASNRAGYATSSAGVHALKRPSVKERIAQIREERMPGLLLLSIDTIEGVMRDTGAPASARVAAADKGFKANHQYNPGQNVEKTIETMTVNEIDQDANRQILELLELRPGEFAPHRHRSTKLCRLRASSADDQAAIRASTRCT